MKQFWLYVDKWQKDLITEAIESGVDLILTRDEFVPKIKELGRIRVASETKGDLTIPKDVETIIIKDKDAENEVASLLQNKIVAVKTTDWDIIPIENLIPRSNNNLFSFVRNLDDAKLALEIMEKGVDGIVLETNDASEISTIAKYVQNLNNEEFKLTELTVKGVKTIGIGDRVCVDTCSNLDRGEGLLVGNSSNGMFLVHAENIDNPYVAQRPFRVNAGAVHSYVRVPGNKTRYLGELESGDPVSVTNFQGNSYIAYVGRAKIEKRPMLVVYAEDSSGAEYSVVLQNAETIRLTLLDGIPISVVNLKNGDKILGYIESGGRHFGMSVDESILEK